MPRGLCPLPAAALVLALAAAASAAPQGILWVQGQGPAFTQARVGGSGNLRYYGGPVIPHARVTVVFWGDGVAPETRSKIGPFYANILDSGYMDWRPSWPAPTRW